jgi:hypothetical protein
MALVSKSVPQFGTKRPIESKFVIHAENEVCQIQYSHVHSHVKRGRWHRSSTRERRFRPGNTGHFRPRLVKPAQKYQPSTSFSTRELCDYDHVNVSQIWKNSKNDIFCSL